MKRIAMLLVIAMLLALFGCAKRPAEETPEPPAPGETAVTVQEEPEAKPKPEIKPTAVREPEVVTPKAPAAEPEKPETKTAEKQQTAPVEKPKAEPVKPQSETAAKPQTSSQQPATPKEEMPATESTPEPVPEPKPEPEPEIEPKPQPVIDTGALASAGRSYASSLGFSVDTSLNLGNASYFPGDRIRLDSMNSGYSIVCSDVQVTYDSLMYADGSIDGTRLNVLVTDDGGGIYTVWVLYG